MAKITNITAYRVLKDQINAVEMEHAAEYQAHGNNAKTCILKAKRRDLEEKLTHVMSGAIYD